MKSPATLSQRLINGDLSIIFYMSVFKLVFQLVVNIQGGYGLFRDEFYYIACADNLAAGYVDHPPLSIYILSLMVNLFGDSLFVVRFVPAFAGAATVFLVGLIAMEMGGRRLAVFLSCLFSMSLINSAMFGFYSMNSLEILTWTIVGYIVVTIIKEGKPQTWIALGIIVGLGLLNKIGVFFLGAGLVVGLIATRERRWLTTPWPYVAGTIALLLFSPYVIWNVVNDFPHLEFIRNASSEKYASLSPITFMAGQILINNPVGVLVWLPGIFALLFNEHLKRFRWLAYLYIVPLLILLINKTSKAEYLAPSYGVLWAAGSVWWERMLQSKPISKYALSAVVFLWLVVSMIFMPMVLPVLPVEKYIAYAKLLNFQPESPEGKEQSELPQFYADMFGWKEKAEAVAEVFASLPAEDKAKCAIFSNNYGRCASIDYYGKEYDLPKTIGNHNNYWIWGSRGHSGEVVIILGGNEEDHQGEFQSVTLARRVDCTYCMPYEDNVGVFVCRGIKRSIDDIWKDEKHFE